MSVPISDGSLDIARRFVVAVVRCQGALMKAEADGPHPLEPRPRVP